MTLKVKGTRFNLIRPISMCICSVGLCFRAIGHCTLLNIWHYRMNMSIYLTQLKMFLLIYLQRRYSINIGSVLHI